MLNTDRDINIIISYNVVIIDVNGFICINNLMELLPIILVETFIICFNSKFFNNMNKNMYYLCTYTV